MTSVLDKTKSALKRGKWRSGLRIEMWHAGEFETAKAAFLEIRGILDVIFLTKSSCKPQAITIKCSSLTGFYNLLRFLLLNGE